MSTQELIQGSSLLLSKLSHYNQWMADRLDRLGPIEGTVLEFGCGSGGMARAIVSLPGVRRLIANDVSPHVKDYFGKNLSHIPNLEFSDANIFEQPEVFAAMNYDIAVTSNTLEHIEQDALALKRIAENARTRTAVVLVPAFECLYGTCDADGGHLRRYKKATFRRMAESVGLEVERISYFNMLGAFGWWTQYVLLRRTDYETESHATNYSIFDKFIVPVYSRIERVVPCPFGLSLVARVRSPRR
jgi:SAM-dependent methyltransferase